MLKLRWLAKDIGIIPDFLSAEECAAFIRFSEDKGYGEAPVTTAFGMVMMKDVRNNDRVMVDDAAEAARLHARARPFLPPKIHEKWRPCGLNERLRFYRYDRRQQFDWHYDGCYERETGERSFFTFMIYLNEGFSGGNTIFDELGDVRGGPNRLVVSPQQGMALLFRHPLLHQGEPVAAGRKYVLRTDVMYTARKMAAVPEPD